MCPVGSVISIWKNRTVHGCTFTDLNTIALHTKEIKYRIDSPLFIPNRHSTFVLPPDIGDTNP
jgi:hypothetical protein